MSDCIHVLDFQVANLIAAGEVVERPAAAVKELLENAIDAGATKVTVEIKKGGVSFIRVTDNGRGMSREDAQLCIRRHATSKIRTAADLDGITTLGFRGEALAAISAVSSLRIMTRRKEDPVGTLVCCEGGEITEVTDAGCSSGTTMIAEQLFANIPARRKFLKKDVTEAMAVAAVVEKEALAHPEVAIHFINDNIVRFSTAGDGILRNAIYAVLGRDFARKLIEVKSMTEGITVDGYIGNPDNVRGNRNVENFFINGRYIKSATATAALEQAFDSYIPSDKFPCCVLRLTIHPSAVDVNVHPTKLEVKFSGERTVFDAIYSAVRNALVSSVRSPGMTIGEPHTLRGSDARVVNAFAPVPERAARPDEAPPTLQSAAREAASQPEPIISLPPIGHRPEGGKPGKEASPEEAPPLTDADCPPPLSDASQSAPSDTATPANTAASSVLECDPVHPHVDLSLFDMPAPAEKNDAPVSALSAPDAPGGEVPREVPFFKYQGVAFNAYIFLEYEDRILVIDKHAAHERILFEQMKQNMRRSEHAEQMLLIDEEIVLDSLSYAAVAEYGDELRAAGFSFTLEENRVLLHSIPLGLELPVATALFSEIVSRLSEGTGNGELTREIVFEKALYQASCKAAVKAGRIDDEAHTRYISEQVLSNPEIRFCPHGRPVVIEITKSDLEKQFKRT